MKLKPSRPSWIAWYCRVGSVITLTGILVALALMLLQTVPLLRHSGLNFLTGTEWYYRDAVFGALPMIYGTVVVSAVALSIAAPLGLGAAIFISEYLPTRIRLPMKSGIELLAGIPSVIYGLIGVLFLRKWVYNGLSPLDPVSGDSLLTAGLLLAVMILPTVATLSDDALQSVPDTQRSAARGLGLTRAETVLHVALPQAIPGLVAAGLLGLGRALGETVAVFLVVGRQDNQLPGNPFSLSAWLSPGQTLTSKIGGPETHIAYGDPLHWSAISGLAVVLFMLVVFCLIGARVIEHGMQSRQQKSPVNPLDDRTVQPGGTR